MKLRISPSLLETFRVVSLGLYNNTPANLVEAILGERVKTPAMSRGSAYHNLLEFGGDRYRVNSKNGVYYEVPDAELGVTWKFSEAAALPALQLRAKYVTMLHEVKGILRLQIGAYEIEMAMRYDGVLWNGIHEFKTTKTAPTFMKYYDSYQWRCYLLACPDASQVDYTVFHIPESNRTCTPHFFKMRRDNTVESGVTSALTDFLAWLEGEPACLARLEQKAAQARAEGLEPW